MKREVRGADLMCRLGGEEFVVVMPDTRLAVAQSVGERVRAAVAASPFPIDNGERAIPVTVSIGVAESLGDELTDALSAAGRPGALSLQELRPQPRHRRGG